MVMGRQIFINLIAFGFVGGVLASADVMFYSHWQYWAINIAMLVVQINSTTD
jgi:hypothetical protein